jgi:hypothetical protein
MWKLGLWPRNSFFWEYLFQIFGIGSWQWGVKSNAAHMLRESNFDLLQKKCDIRETFLIKIMRESLNFDKKLTSRSLLKSKYEITVLTVGATVGYKDSKYYANSR